MTRQETVPAFASRMWRLVLFYVRDQPELLDVAQLIAVGLTDTAQLAAALEIEPEMVEVRKAALHEQVAALTARIESGRRLARSHRAGGRSKDA